MRQLRGVYAQRINDMHVRVVKKAKHQTWPHDLGPMTCGGSRSGYGRLYQAPRRPARAAPASHARTTS